MIRPALPSRVALAAVLALAPLAACQSTGSSASDLRADASATADCLDPAVAQQKAMEQAANPTMTETVGTAAAAGAGQVAGAAVAGPIGAAVGGAIASVLGRQVIARKPPKPCPVATPAEQASAAPPPEAAQPAAAAAPEPAAPDPAAQPAPAQPPTQTPPSPGG